jgi:hypothetical protein
MAGSLTSVDIHFHDTTIDGCLDLFFGRPGAPMEDQEART